MFLNRLKIHNNNVFWKGEGVIFFFLIHQLCVPYIVWFEDVTDTTDLCGLKAMKWSEFIWKKKPSLDKFIMW